MFVFKLHDLCCVLTPWGRQSFKNCWKLSVKSGLCPSCSFATALDSDIIHTTGTGGVLSRWENRLIYTPQCVTVACRPSEKRRRLGEIGSIHMSYISWVTGDPWFSSQWLLEFLEQLHYITPWMDDIHSKTAGNYRYSHIYVIRARSMYRSRLRTWVQKNGTGGVLNTWENRHMHSAVYLLECISANKLNFDAAKLGQFIGQYLVGHRRPNRYSRGWSYDLCCLLSYLKHYIHKQLQYMYCVYINIDWYTMFTCIHLNAYIYAYILWNDFFTVLLGFL